MKHLFLNLIKRKYVFSYLKLEDYFILGLELYMSEHDYDDLKVYHFKDIIQDIKNQIKPDLREIERIVLKISPILLRISQIIKFLKITYLILINKKEEHLNYENPFS